MISNEGFSQCYPKTTSTSFNFNSNKPFNNTAMFFHNAHNNGNLIPVSSREKMNSSQREEENSKNNQLPKLTKNDLILNQINQVIEKKKKLFNAEVDQNSHSTFKKKVPRNPFQNTHITSIKNNNKFQELPSIKDKHLDPTHEYNPNAQSVSSYSYNENKNYPNRKDMQDFHKIIDKYIFDTQGYFALFDGHGGPDHSRYCKDRLDQILFKHLEETNFNYESSLVSSFRDIDREIKAFPTAEACGTTATIIIICNESHQVFGEKRVIFSANLGDSKSIIINSDGQFKRITTEHRLNNKFEIDRIKSNEGIIFNGRLFGQLALSRALGDFSMKGYGLIATPSIYKKTITDKDKYVVICSDGVWDVVEESEVSDLCFRFVDCDSIGKEIINKALKKGSDDNISCIVIKL